MEFDFNVSSLFGSEIVKLSGDLLGDDSKLNRRSLSPNNRDLIDKISIVINQMGEASAKAQGLHHTITTYNKLLESKQTLYLMKDDVDHKKCVVVGILKVGRKKLFLQDSEERLHEMDPLCVLDFYIHESYQRKGCGLKLFEYMLKDQNAIVYELAIDRPSEKLQGFMKKHYKHLGEPVHQRNYFTVYKEIFTMSSQRNELKSDVSRRRLRFSDQTVTNNTTSHWSRSQQRHSYPNYDMLNSGCSSVAAVVFGQRLSQDFDRKVEDSAVRILKQTNENSGSSYSDKCYQAVDSSMNIFGVPSPSNRFRLA